MMVHRASNGKSVLCHPRSEQPECGIRGMNGLVRCCRSKDDTTPALAQSIKHTLAQSAAHTHESLKWTNNSAWCMIDDCLAMVMNTKCMRFIPLFRVTLSHELMSRRSMALLSSRLWFLCPLKYLLSCLMLCSIVKFDRFNLFGLKMSNVSVLSNGRRSRTVSNCGRMWVSFGYMCSDFQRF